MNTDQRMPLEETIQAAKTMDWQQVVQNGGPPCFHLEDNGSFCGRAKVWQGHGSKHTHHHRFIPLDELLSTVSALHHLEAGKRDGDKLKLLETGSGISVEHDLQPDAKGFRPPVSIDFWDNKNKRVRFRGNTVSEALDKALDAQRAILVPSTTPTEEPQG